MAHVITQIQRPQEKLVAKFKGFGAATVYEAAGRIGSVDPSIKPAYIPEMEITQLFFKDPAGVTIELNFKREKLLE